MTARSVASDAQASSCYFRTTTDGHYRKALVQIDERCNLHCAHCFVSATRHGGTMPYEQITPDLAVILNAAPAVLTRRLASRGGTHSRFERRPDGPATEASLYHDTTARLTALGWPVCSIDTTDRAPGDVAAIVIDRILPLHADRSAHGG